MGAKGILIFTDEPIPKLTLSQPKALQDLEVELGFKSLIPTLLYLSS
jgi:hypothetical protein